MDAVLDRRWFWWACGLIVILTVVVIVAGPGNGSAPTGTGGSPGVRGTVTGTASTAPDPAPAAQAFPTTHPPPTAATTAGSTEPSAPAVDGVTVTACTAVRDRTFAAISGNVVNSTSVGQDYSIQIAVSDGGSGTVGLTSVTEYDVLARQTLAFSTFAITSGGDGGPFVCHVTGVDQSPSTPWSS